MASSLSKWRWSREALATRPAVFHKPNQKYDKIKSHCPQCTFQPTHHWQYARRQKQPEAIASSEASHRRPIKSILLPRTRPVAPPAPERRSTAQKKLQNDKTYNSRDSLLVTHATTNRPQGSLSMEERTGFRVLYLLWSYVEEQFGNLQYRVLCIGDE
ncbi:uncharacterized protein IWZ02DRAFT_519154 [Phyllosticta citriasiana]|uniref:uncharacterized protein n=1 Tax=Phyllosticta citriasiana TaxID=595635 RepID=UPI0030FD98EB